MTKNSPTVFLGMSGGVDSAVSAVLLKEQGYNIVGVYMKNWSRDLPGMRCPWAEDLADAKRVAVKLGIDFRVFDFEVEYKDKVVQYMLDEFKAGRTPNPDIMCNQEVKFKLFYETARAAGADLIATGHYARVDNHSHPARLLKAVDTNKDQTYFLYRISEEALVHTLFPVGAMLKPEVKALAKQKELAVAHKKESMGVCFVGDVGIKEFLKEYLPETPGDIREIETDRILGTHEGAVFYTIGQRHGLNIGGGLPYYVVKKNINSNIVYVSKNLNHDDLWLTQLTLEDVIWRNNELTPPTPPITSNSISTPTTTPNPTALNIEVRLRHRAPLIPAKIQLAQPSPSITPTQSSNTTPDTTFAPPSTTSTPIAATITFEKLVKSPAPGQSVVFYREEECLGGGIVSS